MTGEDEVELFDAAAALAAREAETSDDGEGVAAAARADDGAVITGVWVDAMVDSACLCAETGPICEAHRSGRRLLASICVRVVDGSDPMVLAACGVCQERLAVFGTDVLVGVGDDSSRGFAFRPLRDLRPAPWWDAIDPGAPVERA